MDLQAAWQAVVGSPAFGVLLTLAAYELGRRLRTLTRGNPLAQPVLVAIIVIGVVLWLTGTTYDEYLRGGSLIAFLLGPAVVSLAVPLHHEVERVRRALVPIVVAVTLGAVTSITTAVLVTRLLGGDRLLVLSMSPKATSTPVAIALSAEVGGVPALTAVLTITAGILGAVAAPAVLSLFRFRDQRVRGIAIGSVSHGIGTARALHESRTEGAFSGLAMGLTALATSVLLPVLLLVL